ncbi:MAG: ribosome silencing factor [Clostridia bacterium]|nr:ribosome silencing factor [Clostridia bacterium]
MSLELTKKIVKVLDDKLARDIEVIKTEEVTIVADYFVIATANSNTHVRALADEIEYQLEQEDIRPDHVEGRATGWVLMQYGGVVVHIFLEDSRQYYNLERLWDDASKIDISEFID